MLEQRFAWSFAGNVGRAGENRIEIAVRLEQLQRRLVAHAFDAGDVVGAVAYQREIVYDPLGTDAEALARVGLVNPLLFDRRLSASAWIEQRDAFADQLVKVLVTRDDDGLHPVARGALRERRDDIVGLIPIDCDHRDAERIQDLADALQRAIEVLLHLFAQLFARRLVLGVLLLPERDAAIVHPADVFGMVILVQPQQEVGDAPDR